MSDREPYPLPIKLTELIRQLLATQQVFGDVDPYVIVNNISTGGIKANIDGVAYIISKKLVAITCRTKNEAE
jgi:hypothetical protein